MRLYFHVYFGSSLAVLSTHGHALDVTSCPDTVPYLASYQNLVKLSGTLLEINSLDSAFLVSGRTQGFLYDRRRPAT